MRPHVAMRVWHPEQKRSRQERRLCWRVNRGLFDDGVEEPEEAAGEQRGGREGEDPGERRCLRTVDICRPLLFAAMVPAMPELEDVGGTDG